MILYILITTAALLPAYYAQKHERAGNACLFTIFLVLTVPAVLRQETGNDYMRYVEVFHLAASRAVVPTEPGFNRLARLVYMRITCCCLQFTRFSRCSFSCLP